MMKGGVREFNFGARAVEELVELKGYGLEDAMPLLAIHDLKLVGGCGVR